jgi:hypothetical protein
MTTITTEAIPYHTRNGTWRRGWAKKFRIFRLYIYISNCKMKKRPKRDLMYSGFTQDHCIENKHKLYDRQGGGMSALRAALRLRGDGAAPHPATGPLS